MRTPETIDRIITEIRHSIKVLNRQQAALATALNELRFDYSLPSGKDQEE